MPGDGDWHLARGDAALQVGNVATARDHLHQATLLLPLHAGANFLLGLALREGGPATASEVN